MSSYPDSEFTAATVIAKRNTPHELVARYMMLGPDHRAVFDLLLEKAESGREKYGVLQLDGDTRDFELEGMQELLDYAHYLGAACVKLKRERRDLRVLCDEQTAEIESLKKRLAHAQRVIDGQVRR